MKANKLGLVNPVGLAFSTEDNAFHIVDMPQSSTTDIDFVKVTPLAEWGGSFHIPNVLQNPINMTFDNKSNRLLVLNRQANQLLEVRANDIGNLNPANLIRYDAADFEVQNPQGMTVDPATGNLFILDAAEPRIVKVQPSADGSFNELRISEIRLDRYGFSAVRSIAFDPALGHFFVVNPIEQTLYELSGGGELIASRDLAPFGLRNPQAMVFAPSGDQTDDPAQMNLYIVDSGVLEGQSRPDPSATQPFGQIVELSLSALSEPVAANSTATLIRTTNLGSISPPSPDPSGITYLPSSDTLLIVDAEVEETINGITHFQGANVWELTLAGSKLRTANISRISPTLTAITNEPTGIALNPSNRHYYVTDDDDKRVYDINPGGDGLIGTSDDTWTYFSTTGAGSGDPEGITFNTWNNHIFVADGVNAEIYEFTMTGTLINHFDVQRYGVGDPESVEFNVDDGTLFIMSSNRSTPVIAETTISGALIQTIDISVTNAQAAAGLAYAPASNGSGVKRFYIVDRGIDNSSDPNNIDGKMYEITAPISGQANIEVYIGGNFKGSYTILSSPSSIIGYPDTLNGPVKVISTSGNNLVTSQRVVYGNSFNELMGYPSNKFAKEYWFPWYDQVNMQTWILVGNPSSTQTAYVNIYIGGTLRGSYAIPPGDRVTPQFAGLVGGPVRVVSVTGAGTSTPINIFASERSLYGSSFNEVMGYPSNQFTTEYWFPWYDQVNMQTWILVGNPSSSQTAYVDIYVGGVRQGDTRTIAPKSNITPQFAGVVNGPVRVVSVTGAGTPSPINIFASERSLYGPSFNEVMGVPLNQFTIDYWYTWYDNLGMQSWILVGNPSSSQTAYVDIYVGGTLRGSYAIPANGRVIPQFNLSSGPVRVLSKAGIGTTTPIPIFTSERSLYGVSFNEMMGYPANQLTTEYWFTWYDSIYMNTNIYVTTP